jgi:hypothetical protein
MANELPCQSPAAGASAILGAVLVLVIGLIWLGRWLVRHEADVKHWWA